jgi:hypothetical protein
MVEFVRDATGPGEVIDRRNPNRGFMGNLAAGFLNSGQPPTYSHQSTNEEWNQIMTEKRPALAGSGWGQGMFPAPTATNGGLPTEGGQLDGLLTQMFSALSDRIAGGQRSDARDLLPEVLDPDEGTIPEEFLADVTEVEYFDPTTATPADVAAFDINSVKPGTGAGKEGKGLDWFRKGEAPNNYANKDNPLYRARREFAMAIAPQLEELFGVSAQGSAGHMRKPSSGDAAAGGRSANSDHYSGGALDLFGTKEEMVALRNWAIEQPWVSFVRCQSESHHDHVHLSIDLGWVKENFFQNQDMSKIHAAGAPSAAAARNKSYNPLASQKPTSAATSPKKPPVQSAASIAATQRTKVL